MRIHIETTLGKPAIADMAGATVELKPRIGLPVPVERCAKGSLPVGRVLRGRYVIQGILGSGGRGTVYKALDRYRSALPPAEQHVALKVLHPGGECAAGMLEELGRELHRGQALSHRNIVNVYELDRDEDVIFFTMELIHGELLSDVIDRRVAAMPPAQVWQLVRQLGAGLQHAHERGIVHGDLKPRNILVTLEGELRILDFGCAKRLDDRAGVGESGLRVVYGTPAYASCELLEGHDPDPRDDLYALACITYELLTGEHPFDNRPATIARNYGVQAIRPAGLTGRQWRTLQAGLAWHRVLRAATVQDWVQKLTGDAAPSTEPMPLQGLLTSSAPVRRSMSRAAAVYLTALLVVGSCLGTLLHASTKSPAPQGADARRAATAVIAPTGMAATAGATADATTRVAAAAQRKPAAPGAPGTPAKTMAISIDGSPINPGDRFAEIRVHRDASQAASPFVWWTEPATATQGVDYVHQAKAIQSFPSGRRSTHLYVKLLPGARRSRREYFYVAIAQPGRHRKAARVIRAPIWLPAPPKAALQARR